MCVRQLNTTCIAVKERALTRRTEWVGTGGGGMRDMVIRAHGQENKRNTRTWANGYFPLSA